MFVDLDVPILFSPVGVTCAFVVGDASLKLQKQSWHQQWGVNLSGYHTL